MLSVTVVAPTDVVPRGRTVVLFLGSVLGVLTTDVPIRTPIPKVKVPVGDADTVGGPLPTMSYGFHPTLLPFSVRGLGGFPVAFLFFPRSDDLYRGEWAGNVKDGFPGVRVTWTNGASAPVTVPINVTALDSTGNVVRVGGVVV